jgi:hypothetical protein
VCEALAAIADSGHQDCFGGTQLPRCGNAAPPVNSVAFGLRAHNFRQTKIESNSTSIAM